MTATPTVSSILPKDSSALLIGRVAHEHGAPIPVLVREGQVFDLRTLAPTVAEILALPELARKLHTEAFDQLCSVELLGGEHDTEASYTLLSPIDLQVIKACGVTFAESMLERLIEERSHGDAAAATRIRAEIVGQGIGGEILDLQAVTPGSEAAARIRERLMEQGLWSQYLEVGLGPDPEVFTKAPVLSSVGSLSDIGIPHKSSWNNPEPELVLVVTGDGTIAGVTLGNDVNLRDIEGRSALLLGQAKDNNRSTSLGPFIRLFDEHFTIEDARSMTIHLTVTGTDGFELRGSNEVARISRSFEELVSATWGNHHQYPDGFVLFTGTLFAPTKDRDEPGAGFTHHLGDVVTIESEALGALSNVVGRSEELPRWEYGISELLRALVHDSGQRKELQ